MGAILSLELENKKLTLNSAVLEAIENTQPTKQGERHRRIFDLVRRLKAVPELEGRSAREVRQLARQWHTKALPVIGTADWDTTWDDFTFAWTNAKYAWGTTMSAILERATTENLPEAAYDYENPKRQLLVALCRELQRDVGDQPFFLSTRTLNDLLDITSMEAWRWLQGLCRVGILQLVKTGNRHKATEFRYLGPLED